MINLTFDGTDKRVVRGILGRVPAITAAVSRRFTKLSLMLQQKIQSEKLQGQVLQHRTGKLAASIRTQPTTVEGSEVRTGVAGGGGVAPYGAVQNYGGRKSYEIVPVNKKALAFFPSGGMVPINKATMRSTIRGFNSKSASVRLASFSKFGQLGGVVVRKVVHPPLPARNFMESSADEMRQTWVDETTDAVKSGLRGEGK